MATAKKSNNKNSTGTKRRPPRRPSRSAKHPANKNQHAKHEKIIMKGLSTFIEVGNALKWIKDNNSYKTVDNYKTFEDYVRERWDMARRTAYQYIEASEVVENVRKCAQTVPTNECQVRPLVGLQRRQQQQVWRMAVKEAKGAPTGALVRKLVDELKAKTSKGDKSNSAPDTHVTIKMFSKKIQPVLKTLEALEGLGNGLKEVEDFEPIMEEVRNLHKRLDGLLNSVRPAKKPVRAKSQAKRKKAA